MMLLVLSDHDTAPLRPGGHGAELPAGVGRAVVDVVIRRLIQTGTHTAR